MHQTKLAATAALAVAIPGLVIGLLLLLIPTSLLIGLVFVIMGIVTVISSIPGLIAGVAAFSTPVGKLSLVVSAISAVVGFLMIFNHNDVLMIVLGVYMILLPIVNILLAKEKVSQLKAELPKLIIGVLLVLLGPANTLDLLFRIVGWLAIALSVVYALFVFFTVARRKSAPTPATGRIYVDFDGDGKVDGVDEDGDGTVDTVFIEGATSDRHEQ